jgi:DNA-binding FadR family transcriptional regulator
MPKPAVKRETVRATPTRAYVDVAQLLLQRLRSAEYAPGTRLPAERQLAEELGVSRPTVREALAALELMGVVDTHMGAGTFVREIPPHDAANGTATTASADASPSEVLQARLLIEPSTARLAALHWDRPTLAAIQRPLRQLERAAEAGSDAHPTKEDRQFHTAIAAAAGNSVLDTLLAPLWAMMSQSLWRNLKERGWTATHTAIVATEHREIFEAIRSRDGELAAFTMEKHIRGVITDLYRDVG